MSRSLAIRHLPVICGIYKITAPDGKINIGQSHDIYERWNFYKTRNCKSQWKLHKSLVHFGWDAHAKEIIQVCESLELNYWEKYHSKQCGSWNTPWALNVKECGGSKGRLGEESKKLIGIAQSGPQSEERKEKDRATRKKNGTDKLTLDHVAKVVKTIKENKAIERLLLQLPPKIYKRRPKTETEKSNISIGTMIAMSKITLEKKIEINTKREVTRKLNQRKRGPWSNILRKIGRINKKQLIREEKAKILNKLYS